MFAARSSTSLGGVATVNRGTSYMYGMIVIGKIHKNRCNMMYQYQKNDLIHPGSQLKRLAIGAV